MASSTTRSEKDREYICEGNNRSRIVTATSLEEAAELYMERFGCYPRKSVRKDSPMALFYCYVFVLKREWKYIYAPSERQARLDFKEEFGVEAGELVERRNW